MVDELRIQGHRGDAEVRVARPALLAQLSDGALDDVDRHREADALAAARARLDLLVDADHAPVGADERPAGVARVDRGVGLDRARDRELRQRRDGAVDRRDDPDRERPGLPERRTDRRDGLSDLDLRALAQRQRPQLEALRGRCAAARCRRSGRARAPSRPRGCRPRTRRRPPRRASSAAPSPVVTTCALVTISPSSLSTKPDPSPPSRAEQRLDRDDAGRLVLVDLLRVEAALGADRRDDLVARGRRGRGARPAGGSSSPPPQPASATSSGAERQRARLTTGGPGRRSSSRVPNGRSAARACARRARARSPDRARRPAPARSM